MKQLLHIKVGVPLRSRMDELIELGLFTNQGEIVREGLRDILERYTKSK